jgi:hypothetical protein
MPVLANTQNRRPFNVSEQSFSCINDWPKLRNTHIYNGDTDKLNEAINGCLNPLARPGNSASNLSLLATG